MAGKIIFVPEVPHQCSDLPDSVPWPDGTIWECEVCGQQWVRVSGAGEDNAGYSAWRQLTEKNRNGQDA